ncbi:glutathione S-transferase family protein [Colwellia sp. MEBiC06753]
MIIHSFPTFNLTKVLLTAEEAGQPYQLNLLDLTQGEHKSPEHLLRHPLGKVPTVEIDGQHFFESNTICRLIAEQNNNVLYGDSPTERAAINQWVDFAALHIGRWLTVVFFETQIKALFSGGAPDQAALDEANSFLAQQLPVLENQLAKGEFIVGDKPTIADTITYAYFETVDYTGVDLSAYPNIQRWLEQIKSRPSFKNAMAKVPSGEMFPMLKKANS